MTLGLQFRTVFALVGAVSVQKHSIEVWVLPIRQTLKAFRGAGSQWQLVGCEVWVKLGGGQQLQRTESRAMLSLLVGNAEHFVTLQIGGTFCLGGPQECGKAGIEPALECTQTFCSHSFTRSLGTY